MKTEIKTGGFGGGFTNARIIPLYIVVGRVLWRVIWS